MNRNYKFYISCTNFFFLFNIYISIIQFWNIALETAFLNARKFSEDINPKIVHIDTIKFIKPVESGHIIQFRSRVNYTSENIVRISVLALDISQNEQEGNLTNEFHFVFELSKKAKEVIPETYFEALQYLEAKRRTEHILSF